jgi:hypothetical protein
MVAVDSNGYVWIGYYDYTGTYYYPYVIKSGNNDGTWGTTPSGFPHQLSTTSSTAWRVSVVPLTGGKMLVVYTRGSETIKVKSWDGSAWRTEVATTSTIGPAYLRSEVANGDDVHIAFQDTAYNLRHAKYVYSTNSFTNEVLIASGFSSITGVHPAISIDNAGKLYVFWATKYSGYPSGSTAHHIYYQTSTDSGATWSSMVDWINEETDTLTTVVVNGFYKQYGSYIGLTYLTKSVSPYNVNFNFLTIVPPVVAKIAYSDGFVCILTAMLRRFPPKPQPKCFPTPSFPSKCSGFRLQPRLRP